MLRYPQEVIMAICRLVAKACRLVRWWPEINNAVANQWEIRTCLKIKINRQFNQEEEFQWVTILALNQGMWIDKLQKKKSFLTFLDNLLHKEEASQSKANHHKEFHKWEEDNLFPKEFLK